MSSFNSNIFISHFDWIILAVILLLHGLAILYSRKKQPINSSEYLVMGRGLALPLFVPTLVVAWYGKMFTVTQIAFDNGIYNFYTQGIFWYIASMFFAFYLVKKVRSYNAVTLPDLIGKMYGIKSTLFVAILVFVKALPITYFISLSMILQIFTKMTFFNAMYIILLGLILCVALNGMRSFVYSNVIHFICVLVSIGLVLIFSILELGGVNFLFANLPATYFQPRGIHSIINMLAWFALAFSTTAISPVFYQHCLAAKSDRVAIFGVLLATGFWILIDIGTTFGAMYARAALPDADSVSAYSIYAMQLLPNGLKGLFIAGVIGTIIPSITACLSIAGAALHHDILNVKNYYAKSLVNVAVISTMLFMIVCSVFFDGKFVHIWLVFKSFFTGCLLVPILIGYFYPKLVEVQTFFLSSIISCFVMSVWSFCSLQELTRIEPMLLGCISSLFVFVTKYYQYRRNNFPQHFSKSIS